MAQSSEAPEPEEQTSTKTRSNWFKFEISVGTILQLATMLALAAAAYAKFDSRLTVNETSLAAQRLEITRQGTSLNEVINMQTRLMTILEERRGKM